MGFALCVQSARKVVVETVDRPAQGFGGASGAIFGAGAVLALEFGDGFQFAEGFGFDGLGFVFRVEDSFELFFFAEEGAHGLGVVQGEVALLDSRVAFHGCGLAGGGIE